MGTHSLPTGVARLAVLLSAHVRMGGGITADVLRRLGTQSGVLFVTTKGTREPDVEAAAPKCARCGRELVHPRYLGGTAYGMTCIRYMATRE